MSDFFMRHLGISPSPTLYIINIPIQIRSGELNEVNTTSIQIFYFFIPEQDVLINE